MKARALLILWGLSFVLTVGCFAVFNQGLVRDVYTGDPEEMFDPKAVSEWISDPFRVWGQGSYALYVGSVNHDPGPVGRPFTGAFEVRVTNPDDQIIFEKMYPPGSTGHRVPTNYGDIRLDTLTLDDGPWRPWRLHARVVSGDPNFETTQTELRLRRQRYEPGMGGLMNYAMIIPGSILLFVSFLLALPLASSGKRFPLIATVLACLAWLVFLV